MVMIGGHCCASSSRAIHERDQTVLFVRRPTDWRLFDQVTPLDSRAPKVTHIQKRERKKEEREKSQAIITGGLFESGQLRVCQLRAVCSAEPATGYKVEKLDKQLAKV